MLIVGLLQLALSYCLHKTSNFTCGFPRFDMIHEAVVQDHLPLLLQLFLASALVFFPSLLCEFRLVLLAKFNFLECCGDATENLVQTLFQRSIWFILPSLLGTVATCFLNLADEIRSTLTLLDPFGTR
jgi:hypothetical protein